MDVQAGPPVPDRRPAMTGTQDAVPRFVLTAHGTDRLGNVAALTRCLADRRLYTMETHQYQDTAQRRFFTRIAFRPEHGEEADLDEIREDLRVTGGGAFGTEIAVYDLQVRPRVLIMVSRLGHCLYDLMHRWRSGQLPVDVVGVVSNHEDMRSFTEWNGIAYYHLPITRDTKPDQERRLLTLIEELGVDLVVLARYMQVLSSELCEILAGRCINIHHSFLPSFKGAKPYHQAHARGVKLIGATAHYVTTDLDEGPIIEQAARRASHARTADELVTMGQEVECSVLARAVGWHADYRILLNNNRTIIFE